MVITCWDGAPLRKRYEKAEAEYVTAKLELHHKTEVKEQLTEHLYAIIQQNELRKACKLEELMEQLQLQADDEEEEEERKSTELHHQISEEERGGTLSSKTETGNTEPNQSLIQMVTS